MPSIYLVPLLLSMCTIKNNRHCITCQYHEQKPLHVLDWFLSLHLFPTMVSFKDFKLSLVILCVYSPVCMCILTCLCGMTHVQESDQLCVFFSFSSTVAWILGAKTEDIRIQEKYPVLLVFCKLDSGSHFGRGSLS